MGLLFVAHFNHFRSFAGGGPTFISWFTVLRSCAGHGLLSLISKERVEGDQTEGRAKKGWPIPHSVNPHSHSHPQPHFHRTRPRIYSLPEEQKRIENPFAHTSIPSSFRLHLHLVTPKERRYRLTSSEKEPATENNHHQCRIRVPSRSRSRTTSPLSPSSRISAVKGPSQTTHIMSTLPLPPRTTPCHVPLSFPSSPSSSLSSDSPSPYARARKPTYSPSASSLLGDKGSEGDDDGGGEGGEARWCGLIMEPRCGCGQLRRGGGREVRGIFEVLEGCEMGS